MTNLSYDVNQEDFLVFLLSLDYDEESSEKVSSDSGREGCSIFYLEPTGGAALIRKTEVEETQFVFNDQVPNGRAPLATMFFPGFRPVRWLRSVRNSSPFNVTFAFAEEGSNSGLTFW